MKEARVAGGFHPVVVPIRSDKPTGRGKGESSGGKKVLSGKTGRGKGGRESKGSGRSSGSRGRIKKGKGRGRPGPARDGSSSSQVCFKCGSTDRWARDCSKMDDASSNSKKRNLGAYAKGAWTCSTTDNHRGEKCSNQVDDPMCLNLVCDASNHFDDSMCFDFLCGAAITPVQDDDDREAHAAFLVESEGFGVLDCGAFTSCGSAEGAEALFSNVLLHAFQMLIRGRSFNFGDDACFIKGYITVQTPSSKWALGDFCVLAHLFSDQPKPTPWMLGMEFSSRGTSLSCGR